MAVLALDIGGTKIAAAVFTDSGAKLLGRTEPLAGRGGRAVGEVGAGAARGCRDAVCIAVGTGIGAGILVDGRVLRGARDIAGAVGWLALDRPHLPGYAEVGCFEHHAAGPGIVKAARQRLAAAGTTRPASSLHERGTDLTTADVFDAAAAGDLLAEGVIGDAIEFWGMAAANFVSVFDPEVIIFAGGVFGPAAQYIDRIRAVAARWAQPISMPQVLVTVSSLGGDAGLLGAGHLALRALRNDPTTTG